MRNSDLRFPKTIELEFLVAVVLHSNLENCYIPPAPGFTVSLRSRQKSQSGAPLTCDIKQNYKWPEGKYSDGMMWL